MDNTIWHHLCKLQFGGDLCEKQQTQQQQEIILWKPFYQQQGIYWRFY
jgi:hypothetical protein